MEDLGGLIAVGFSLEVDLKDVCAFKLKEDIVLLIANRPKMMDGYSISAR